MTRKANFLERYLLHPLEALAVALLYGLFRILPVSWASALGGWLARIAGPRLGLSERARANLRRALPELTENERERIVRGMWENLGRVAGEFPHLSRLGIYTPGGRIEVIGREWVENAIDGDKPAIFFTAHIGNWEIMPLGITALGTPLDRVFREANNPLVNRLYKLGRRHMQGELIAKGSSGARQLLRALKQGRHIGMLVDQKMNDGIAVPFFGIEAMTAPALAEMALRFDCRIIPARAERLAGARFRMVISPPIEVVRTGNRKEDVLRIMTDVNRTVEGWIRAKPEQWLWLHNRWPDQGDIGPASSSGSSGS